MKYHHDEYESGPWTIERVLSSRISSYEAHDVLSALAGQEKELTSALLAKIDQLHPLQKVGCAGLLLALGDTSEKSVLLEALASEDRPVWVTAESWFGVLVPFDTPREGTHTFHVGITSAELFEHLQPLVTPPYTYRVFKSLQICLHCCLPYAEEFANGLLQSDYPGIRLLAASAFLNLGDNRAVDVATELLWNAPYYTAPILEDRDGWSSIKQLWWTLGRFSENASESDRLRLACSVWGILTDAFNAEDRAKRFDTNEGYIWAGKACELIVDEALPEAKPFLEQLVAAEDLSAFDRGQVLKYYADNFGHSAKPQLLNWLEITSLRGYAANALASLVKGDGSTPIVDALRAALSASISGDIDECGDDNPIESIALALAATGPDGLQSAKSALEHVDPWTRFELLWQIQGRPKSELAELLDQAGAIDALSSEQLESATSENWDFMRIVGASPERAVQFSVKSYGEFEHYRLFNDLLCALRPQLDVTAIVEKVDAKYVSTQRREEVVIPPDLELGTTCTVEFNYQGQSRSFQVHPRGRWHDVPGVMRGFDEFMRSIGRDERCFELKFGGEFAFFLVAPAIGFQEVADRLQIPLETDSEAAREAAKEYVRFIQSRSS